MTFQRDVAISGQKLSNKNCIPGEFLNDFWELDCSFPRESWSCYVWYMDKNRPLPPGTAFDEFRIACKEYDESDIKVSDFNFDNHLGKVTVYISELKRTRATLDFLNTNTEVLKTELINEVLIEPFIETNFKLPLLLWMIFGRLQWFFNIKRHSETRFDTTQKIQKFIDLILEEKGDVLVIGHGFYFSYLKRFLKKEFSGENKSIYKNGDVIQLERIVSC